MSAIAGFRRISRLIRWLAYLLWFGAVVTALYAFSETRPNDSLIGAAIFAGVGGLVFLAAWVLDGFLERGGEAPSVSAFQSSPPPASDPISRDTLKPIVVDSEAPSMVALRWGLIAGSVALGSMVVLWAGGSADVGRYIGNALGILILVAVADLIFKRVAPAQYETFSGKGLGIAYAVIVLVWAVKLHVDSVRERDALVAGVAALRETVESVDRAQKDLIAPKGTAPQVVPAPAPIAISSPGGASSAMQQVVQAIGNIAQRRNQLDRDYSQKLDSLGVSVWLANETLWDSRARAAYRPKVQAGLVALATYEKDGAILFEEMDREIKRIDAVPGGSGAYAGFQKTQPEAKSLMKQMAANERALMNSVLGLYSFLDSDLINYEISNGQILFSSELDLELYRAKWRQISALGEESTKLTARGAEARQRSISGLKEMEEAYKSRR